MDKNHDIDRRDLCLGAAAALGLAQLSFGPAHAEKKLAVAFPPLPYPEDALAPVITSETVALHYGRHHKGYYEAVLKTVGDGELADLSLEQIIVRAASDPARSSLFNPAGQLWNHNFYWTSMRPKGGGKPSGAVAGLIEQNFGGYDGFRKEFITASTKLFGSGWIWLVQTSKDKLALVATPNADSPLAHGGRSLLTCDVWEHA